MSVEIRKKVPLAPYTTFKIGGPAEFFAEIKDKNDLLDSFKWAKENSQNIFILGGGSNLLISDRGISGLVLFFKKNDYKILDKTSEKKIGDKVKVSADAGVMLSGLALKLAENELSGLEWSVGIPRATVGGSVRGNAGAFGVTMGDLVYEVEVFDLNKEEFKTFHFQDCQFAYRESVFKKDKKYLIWSVVLKMEKKNKVEIKKKIEKSIQHRKNGYPKFPSAGSVFKNTAQIETVRKYNPEVAREAEESGAVNENRIIPSGFLIERFGLKGKKIGGAKVSEQHANFIINTGNATAENVIILMSLIKQKIRDNYGVQLEEEIELVGF